MFIGMLFAMAIVLVLYTGAASDDLLMAVLLYGGLIVGMIAALWYSNKVSGGIAGAILGGSGGKIDQTDAHANALISERRYDEAAELYRRAISKNKKNPALRLKLADIYLKLGDFDNCIKYVDEAVRMPKGLSEDERCARINRLADLYLQEKRDPASAVAALELILKDYPRSKHAVFARERIKAIKPATGRATRPRRG